MLVCSMAWRFILWITIVCILLLGCERDRERSESLKEVWYPEMSLQMFFDNLAMCLVERPDPWEKISVNKTVKDGLPVYAITMRCADGSQERAYIPRKEEVVSEEGVLPGCLGAANLADKFLHSVLQQRDANVAYFFNSTTDAIEALRLMEKWFDDETERVTIGISRVRVKSPALLEAARRLEPGHRPDLDFQHDLLHCSISALLSQESMTAGGSGSVRIVYVDMERNTEYDPFKIVRVRITVPPS